MLMIENIVSPDLRQQDHLFFRNHLNPLIPEDLQREVPVNLSE